MPRAIDIGTDILATTRDAETKTILAQTGDVVGETVEADNVEMWQHVGFASRPPKADPKKAACQAVVIRDTGYDACVATRDLRGQELAGSLKEGETCVYAAGAEGKGQARILLKQDSSIALYTKKPANDASGMAIILSPEADEIHIVNAAGYGIVINGDGVFVTSKDATLSLGANGDAKLIGTGLAQVDGSSVVIGGSQIMQVGLNSALTGVTGMAGKASMKVLIE